MTWPTMRKTWPRLRALTNNECSQPIIDALRLQAGFWISEALYQRVLRDAGE